ncbi:hypothetical protein [Mesorhizobium sp. CA16]|uniref:hypothetical protein n=1 Tax=Mesorhizobium sp. CA16 TaxID=588496 RepID=UPI001CC9284B|nr:hypothetical protein [Mesorhizobium sp. CA16]MBZ9914006.1 hypothetical protein [Mesorhizobium sp. CA16]
MSDEPKSALQRAWRDYKAQVEYTTSPYPFRRRRKTLIDKLHDDFFVLVVLGGFIWVIYKVIGYYLF